MEGSVEKTYKATLPEMNCLEKLFKPANVSLTKNSCITPPYRKGYTEEVIK